ncbi:MAG: OsmC family peroxiredoxin [Chloroflexi bacterium]|nr:OsmC family peroxiredoxin [Chloroflexota bacterium]
MVDILRTGTAVWQGGRSGSSKVSSGSGALKDAPVSVASRFEQAGGTNPEELIASAHAACFSMQFAVLLDRNGTPATEVSTKATLSMKRLETGGWKIYKIQLDCEAKAAGIDAAKFQEIAETAKNVCPVSNLLKPGLEEIVLNAVHKP